MSGLGPAVYLRCGGVTAEGPDYPGTALETSSSDSNDASRVPWRPAVLAEAALNANHSVLPSVRRAEDDFASTVPGFDEHR